ncbi:MAG TPA: FIST N-terminal domain-containing protein [Phycisphaerae bacterium]|jgi:small ligand-binding sensory domain FIST
MRVASALSALASPPAIAQDIEGQLAATRPPDLLLVFVSYALADAFESIVTMLRQALKPVHLLAVAAESIIGVDQEVERSSAVSALAIDMPKDAILHSFHIAEDEWQEVLSEEEFLRRQVMPRGAFGSGGLGGEENPVRAFFMFGDPYTTPIVQLLDACTHSFPGAPVIGGMASGMQHQGDTRLALNDEIHSSGLVGISFSGNVEIDCVVSQGCRPVGETFVVTKCHQNVIEQLDGKPALAAIEEMVQGLPLLDRQLLTTGGLQIGRVIDQGKGNYGRGDFLIRSLVGVDRKTGVVSIGDMVRGGQTLQFHVRDARAADEEMRLLLEGESMLADSNAAGALLITCNGRGTRLFEKPNHDVELTRKILGNIPIAGFFAAGELGPVGEKNFIHGHTAALALFRETVKQD